MNCNCNTIICSNLIMDTNAVVLMPNQPIKSLSNLSTYRLILATNIPEATSNYPVYIQFGSVNVPVLCKFGNEVLANMLNRRVNYPVGFGNQNTNYENGQFVILSCACLNKRGEETTTTTTGD